MLTALVETLVAQIGEVHPRFVEILQAVRAGHLRLLSHLIAPGGTGLFLSDFVSSLTFPYLAFIEPNSWPQVINLLNSECNFFHGVNPLILEALFHQDPVLAPEIAESETITPWRWQFGEREYAVWAIRFRKKVGG